MILVSRGLILLLLCVTVLSCSRDPLPDLPGFDQLGLTQAIEPVKQQVLAAHDKLKENPRDVELNGRLGMLLSAYQRNASADILFQRARMLAPAEFRWKYYHAFVLDQLGKQDEAIAAFRDAIDANPDYLQARLQLADLLRRNNAIAESIALYRHITTEHSVRVEGWLGLGKALARDGDYEAAAAALKRARLLGPQYGEVHYAFANVLLAIGKQDEASRELNAYERTAQNKIPQNDPLIAEVRAMNASDGPHMAAADYHLRHNQLDNAVASFRTAISLNPSSQDAWAGLVNTHTRRGDLDAAHSTFQQALAASIKYPRLHLTYGLALVEHKQYEQARAQFRTAIELDPQYAGALEQIGLLELLDGDSNAAVSYFSRALELRPNDRDLQLLLAQAFNASDRFDEAVAQLEPLSGDPAANMSHTLKELAIAYRGLGRPREALAALRRGRDAAMQSADLAVLAEINALLTEWQ